MPTIDSVDMFHLGTPFSYAVGAHNPDEVYTDSCFSICPVNRCSATDCVTGSDSVN